jgi:hypothetical protein
LVNGQIQAWPLYAEGKTTGTHRVGGWVSPRTGLDDVEKRKILPIPGFEFGRLG